MQEVEKRERRHDRIEPRRRDNDAGGLSIWHVAGGIVLAGLAAAVIVNLRDIKRYIKISTM